MYEMKEEYFTGIKQIDDEHARLFEISEKLYQLLQDEVIHDKYDNIRHILMELKDYTIMHFEHEEAYMESIQYKKMFTQKIQHQAFREKIEELELESIDDGQEDTIKEILEFLTDWLVEHIMDNDKLIGQ